MQIGVIGGSIWGNRGAEAMVATCIGHIRRTWPAARALIFSYFPLQDRRILAAADARRRGRAAACTRVSPGSFLVPGSCRGTHGFHNSRPVPPARSSRVAPMPDSPGCLRHLIRRRPSEVLAVQCSVDPARLSAASAGNQDVPGNGSVPESAQPHAGTRRTETLPTCSRAKHHRLLPIWHRCRSKRSDTR